MQGRGFPVEWLSELKRKNDLVTIASNYLKLEQKGRRFWACCPFHNEKTPSFSITEDGIYHCYGCKESGDVITFVEKMENGYDSHVASGGTNVSGGQKQRLSIARAIARDPEIYIFDDSFSALDYKTDAVLRRELKNYTKDATSVIVAQRIGTIMNADKIIVLDKGECVGMGTHAELLKNCDVYKEIALSQLSEEEL